jgi:hypothetical protein
VRPTALSQVNVDSLWGVWDDKSDADTPRLKAMYDLVFKHYFLIDLDSAPLCAQLMLNFATYKGLKKFQADALHDLGGTEMLKGNNKYVYRGIYLNL